MRSGSKMVLAAFTMVVALVAIVAGWHILTHGRTPEVVDERGQPVPGSVASLEPVMLNGVPQWILVRGRDRTKPILLFVHGGPGVPSMFLHHRLARRLEEDFVVVHWDQRGAGKSASAARSEGIRVSQLVEDTRTLARMLSARFGSGPVILVGHSWGTYLGMLAIRDPGPFRAYVGIGQLAGPGKKDPESDALQEAFIRERAQTLGISEPLGDLTRASTREEWLFRFGAVQQGAESYWPMLMNAVRAPEYTLREVARFKRSVRWVAENMIYDAIPDRLDRAVPAVDVPVWFFTGRHDYTDPFPITERYFAVLRAPRKHMVWFERSAHFPFIEEPEKFADELTKVVAATQGLAPEARRDGR